MHVPDSFSSTCRCWSYPFTISRRAENLSLRKNLVSHVTTCAVGKALQSDSAVKRNTDNVVPDVHTAIGQCEEDNKKRKARWTKTNSEFKTRWSEQSWSQHDPYRLVAATPHGWSQEVHLPNSWRRSAEPCVQLLEREQGSESDSTGRATCVTAKQNESDKEKPFEWLLLHRPWNKGSL